MMPMIISLGVNLNNVLADMVVKGFTIVGLISLGLVSVIIWVTVTFSLAMHAMTGTLLDILFSVLCYVVNRSYAGICSVLEQKGGRLKTEQVKSLQQVQSQVKQAMTATLVLEADKIDLEDFESKYSLIDTGTDAVLRTRSKKRRSIIN
jgi:hypothetical protein